MKQASLWLGVSAALAFLVPLDRAAHADGPKTPSFASVIKENFARWDLDHDGVLSEQEVDRLLRDPSIQGPQAAALATIHHFRRTKQGPVRMTESLLLAESNKTDAPPEERTDQLAKAPHFRSTYAGYVAHIKRVPHEIFHAKDAPTLESFHQGALGDCYFVAAVAAAVARSPASIRRMIHTYPDGSADVSFADGRRTHVAALTDAEIALGSTAGQQGLWLNVLEKAFGQVRRTKQHVLEAPATDIIGTGGSSIETIQLLTGHHTDHVNVHRVAAQQLRGFFQSAQHQKLLACCGGARRGTPGIATNHVFSILDFDAQQDLVTVRNPWGNHFKPKGEPGLQTGYPTENGVFRVSLNEFQQIFGGASFETHRPLGSPRARK